MVPARPREVGLLCRSCSSPRSAVAGFLQTPPRGDALALDWQLSSGILRYMKVNLLQGTCTPTLTPMPGVHKRVARDRRPLADLLKPNGYIWAAARERGR